MEDQMMQDHSSSSSSPTRAITVAFGESDDNLHIVYFEPDFQSFAGLSFAKLERCKAFCEKTGEELDAELEAFDADNRKREDFDEESPWDFMTRRISTLPHSIEEPTDGMEITKVSYQLLELSDDVSGQAIDDDMMIGEASGPVFCYSVLENGGVDDHHSSIVLTQKGKVTEESSAAFRSCVAKRRFLEDCCTQDGAKGFIVCDKSVDRLYENNECFDSLGEFTDWEENTLGEKVAMGVYVLDPNSRHVTWAALLANADPNKPDGCHYSVPVGEEEGDSDDQMSEGIEGLTSEDDDLISV